MGDLADYIRNNLVGLYKQKGDKNFGHNLDASTIHLRVEKMKIEKRNTRRDIAFLNRAIPDDMTPLKSSTPPTSTTTAKPEPSNQVKAHLEKMRQWKLARELSKKQETATRKPIFKVTKVAAPIGLPSLETVNQEIKGKKFKSKFAPNNHKFKPPANIKPIPLTNGQGVVTRSQSRKLTEVNTKVATTKTVKNPASDKTKKDDATTKTAKVSIKKISSKPDKQQKKEQLDELPLPSTSSMRPLASSIEKKQKQKTNTPVKEAIISKSTKPVNKLPNKKISPKPDKQQQQIEQLDESSFMSPDYPIRSTTIMNSSEKKQQTKTPAKQVIKEPPVYTSPFVVVSRGKNNARKEVLERRSKGVIPAKLQQSSSASAGAAHFTNLLDTQISRFQTNITRWEEYKSQSEDLPEEATNMIDVAIGQTNLLITKKFMQFRGLIDACREQSQEQQVKVDDLHGFWDMLTIQVENLEKRFNNLENLKLSNWVEVVPVVKNVVKKKKAKAVKKTTASSALRQAIEAARKKKLGVPTENSEELTNEVNQSVEFTEKRRKSNRLNIKAEQKRISSPGLMMMKVAQYAKSVETPGKSILKTDARKSVKSHSKIVLFQDEIDTLEKMQKTSLKKLRVSLFNEDDDNDVENNANQSNVTAQAPRRSSRVK